MYFVVTNWLNYSPLDRSSPIFISHSSFAWFRSALKPFHRFPMRVTESTSRQIRSINYRSGQWSRGGSAPSGHRANHRPFWPSDPSDCSSRVPALLIRQGQGQGQPICSKSVFRFPTARASRRPVAANLSFIAVVHRTLPRLVLQLSSLVSLLTFVYYFPRGETSRSMRPRWRLTPADGIVAWTTDPSTTITPQLSTAVVGIRLVCIYLARNVMVYSSWTLM